MITLFKDRLIRRATVAFVTAMVSLLPAYSVAGEETTPTVSRWEPRIQKFEADDRVTSPPQNGIVFVGSSSIVGWDVKKAFPGKPVINRGFGGSITADVLEFFDRVVVPYKPQIVVFYSGDNDINGGMSPEVVSGQVKQFVERIHAQVPSAKRIILIPPKPSPSRIDKWPGMKAVGEAQKALAEQHDDVVFIDIAAEMLDAEGKPRPELFKKDMLHLAPAGYDIWNRLIEPHLEVSEN